MLDYKQLMTNSSQIGTILSPNGVNSKDIDIPLNIAFMPENQLNQRKGRYYQSIAKSKR